MVVAFAFFYQGYDVDYTISFYWCQSFVDYIDDIAYFV